MAGRNASIPSSREVDPARLSVYLENHGWRLVGGRRGSYNRFAPAGEESERNQNLLVPLNSDAPDYDIQMVATLKALASSSPIDWASAVPQIASGSADQYSFQKETGAPSGFIRWSDGEKLFENVRSTIVAGAKSHVDPAPYFGNRLSQYARRFLDTALMGLTEPGSYVVTVFVPLNEPVPLYMSKYEGLQLGDLTSTNTARITDSIVGAVEATMESLEHYRARQTYAAFDDGVGRGISYELLHSLAGFVDKSDGAEIVFNLAERGGTDRRQGRSAFEFRPADVSVLRTAGDRLLEDFPERNVEIVGRVHLLRKSAGAKPLIGIEWSGPSGTRRVRAELSDEDYAIAVQAHLNNQTVAISGSLARYGHRMLRLDEAQLREVIEPDLSDRVDDDTLF